MLENIPLACMLNAWECNTQNVAMLFDLPCSICDRHNHGASDGETTLVTVNNFHRLIGLMLLPQKRILVQDVCRETPCEVTPIEFERLAGKGTHRRWRYSISVMEDGACERSCNGKNLKGCRGNVQLMC